MPVSVFKQIQALFLSRSWITITSWVFLQQWSDQVAQKVRLHRKSFYVHLTIPYFRVSPFVDCLVLNASLGSINPCNSKCYIMINSSPDKAENQIEILYLLFQEMWFSHPFHQRIKNIICPSIREYCERNFTIKMLVIYSAVQWPTL